MGSNDLAVTVFKLDNGRWSWDVCVGAQVLATGSDYDRPSRAIAAAKKVTGRTPDVAE